MKAGIVICSRLDSSRVPRKAFAPLNGIPLLQHLVERLLPTGLPLVIAVPEHELPEYRQRLDGVPNVMFFAGYPTDPLRRMQAAALAVGIDVVVRVNHDKVFVQPKDVRRMLEIFDQSTLDYLYSSSFVDGSGFEVIRYDSLELAAGRFKEVEHISYAIQAVTKRKTDVDMGYPKCPHRLLADYREDLLLLSQVLIALGNQCTLDEVLAWLDDNPEISRINRQPLLSVYTCAYNANPNWLRQALASVEGQSGFRNWEYILVDDGSQDATGDVMAQVARNYMNVTYRRNEKNLGLATSSNIAMSLVRGKYVLRLDADDYFTSKTVLQDMIKTMEATDYDALYPDFKMGSVNTIEKGSVHHHVGGAMFRTRALNHLKFTDGLRGYEGYDLFERAKKSLRIGYHEKPTFFYRQHEKSLSKSDPAARAEIKKQIDERIGNES